MSLINDALKKAKQAQPKNVTPAAGPSLQPAEPDRPSRNGSGLLLPIIIALVLVLAAILLGKWFHSTDELKVRANSPAPASTPASTGLTEAPGAAALTNSAVTPAIEPSTNDVAA